MRKLAISRRKFIATSSGVISAITAYALHPHLNTPTAAAQPRSGDELLASIDKISPCGVTEYRLTGAEEQRLSNIPLQLRQIEYEALLGNTPKLASVQHQLSTDKHHDLITKRVLSRINGLQQDGLRYTNYHLQTQIEGVWASERTATVIWTERVRFSMAGDPDPRAPQDYSEIVTHCTLLQRDGADWKIYNDEPSFGSASFRTGQEVPVADPPAGLARSERIPQDVLARTLGAQPQQTNVPGTIAPQATGYNVYLPIIKNGLLQSYSREAATAYALAHGDAPPGDENGYHVFENNCMNFVSQCLQAGGWQEEKGFYTSTEAWWHTGDWPFYASYPWHNSHYWYTFTSNTKRGEIIDNKWDLWFGDVLQFSWKNSGIMDHTSFVSFRSYDGIIYIAQHSNNYSRRPLSDMVAQITAEEPNCAYYPWRMKVEF